MKKLRVLLITVMFVASFWIFPAQFTYAQSPKLHTVVNVLNVNRDNDSIAVDESNNRLIVSFVSQTAVYDLAVPHTHRPFNIIGVNNYNWGPRQLEMAINEATNKLYGVRGNGRFSAFSFGPFTDPSPDNGVLFNPIFDGSDTFGGSGPQDAAIAVHEGLNRAYVVNLARNDMRVYDIDPTGDTHDDDPVPSTGPTPGNGHLRSTIMPIATLSMPENYPTTGSIAEFAQLGSIDINELTNRAYVIKKEGQSSSSYLYIVDIVGSEPIQELRFQSGTALKVKVSELYDRAYVAGNPSSYIIDTTDNSIIETLGAYGAVAVNESNKRAYFMTSTTVDVVDIEPGSGTENQVIATINISSSGLHDIAVNELTNRLYVLEKANSPNPGKVHEIEIESPSQNQPPDAVCTDVTVSSDASCQADADVNNASFDPDDDTITLSQSPAGLYPLGDTDVTLTVDDGLVTDSCTATVTVVDDAAPSITCPAPVVLESTGESGADFSFSEAFTDNCPVTVGSCDSDSGSTFPLGSTNVTCTATDGSGNSASCVFSVTVEDTTAPVVTAPPGVTVEATDLLSVVAIGSATATDEVGVVSLTNDAPASGFAVGTTTVTWTATDAAGNEGTAAQLVTVEDTTAPVVTAPADVTVDETGDLTPVDLGTPVASDIVGVVSITNNAPSGGFPNGPTVVTWTAEDAAGNNASDTQNVTVNNVAPVVGAISAPLDPQAVGGVISASASFTDAGTGDTHTAEWDWGDGNTTTGTVSESGGVGTVADEHQYSAPGIYTVGLTVTDNDGDSGATTFQFVVVYDPSGGFVTGGGWINSPPGAYSANPILTGKANFGFVSKYKKGATTPTGNTEFQFKAGKLNFHSDDYEWLVVAGARAQFKGTGTINGEGDYGFMLTAIDSKVNGGGDVDRFRIKITNNGAGSGVVYDNKRLEADDSNVATALSGGNIVIHKAK